MNNSPRSNAGTSPISGLLFRSDVVESFSPRSEAVRFQTQSTEHTRELMLTENKAAKTRQPAASGFKYLRDGGETIRQVEDMMVIRSGRERRAGGEREHTGTIPDKDRGERHGTRPTDCTLTTRRC